MLNFEEELNKFKELPEAAEYEGIIKDEPLVDMTDILRDLLAASEKKNS